MNSVLIHVGNTIEPDEVNLPKSPDDQVEPAPNTAKGGIPLTKWTTQADDHQYPFPYLVCQTQKGITRSPLFQ